MTDEEFEQRLDKIASLAKAQIEGPYTTESNAAYSLVLMETMALLLLENAKAHQHAVCGA